MLTLQRYVIQPSWKAGISFFPVGTTFACHWKGLLNRRCRPGPNYSFYFSSSVCRILIKKNKKQLPTESIQKNFFFFFDRIYSGIQPNTAFKRTLEIASGTLIFQNSCWTRCWKHQVEMLYGYQTGVQFKSKSCLFLTCETGSIPGRLRRKKRKMNRFIDCNFYTFLRWIFLIDTQQCELILSNVSEKKTVNVEMSRRTSLKQIRHWVSYRKLRFSENLYTSE